MSSWNKVAKSVAVQYVGRVVGLFISLFSTILITRALGVNGYGQYTTAVAVANLIIIFSDLGFFWSTIKNISDQKETRRVAREITGIRLVVTLILIAIALAVIWLTSYPPVVKEAFTILAIFILSSGLNNVLVAIHQGTFAMGWPTIADISGRLVNLILIAIGVWLKESLLWFMVAMSISAAVNFLINWFVLARRHGPIWPKISGFQWSKYYGTVVILGVVTLLNALYLKIDVVLLSAYKPAVDVGIYGAAQKVVEIAMVFQALFVAASFPLLLEKLEQGMDHFRKALSDGFMIVLTIGLPISLILVFLSRDIVGFVAGQAFVETSQLSVLGYAITTPVTLAILAGYVLLAHIDGLFTVSLIATNRLKWLVYTNGLALILNLVLNFALIRHYSYFATAWTTVATEVFIAATVTGKAIVTFRPPISGSTVTKVVLASLISLLVLLIPWHIHVAIQILMILFVYVLVLLVIVPEVRQIIAKYSGGFRHLGAQE